ncbi:MAG: outer membrane protein transport protein [candidate division Zixibacteria bacterium]|nr:outer membrane protein transport protein [candidate division Zixibacteria bacterium]
MRSGRFFGGALFFVLFFAEVSRAGGYALSGVGAHANALGGAFRAVADDWSAAFWNPAGLAFQTRSEVTVGGAIGASRVKYIPRAVSGGYGFGFAADSAQERFPFDQNIPFGNASLFLRFPQLGRLNLGVSVFVPYHSASQWNLFSLPYPFRGDTIPVFSFPEKNFTNRLRVADIHPTAAFSLMDGKLALGGGLSIDRADWNFSRPVLLPVEDSYEPLTGTVDTVERVFENNPNLITYQEENVVSIMRLGLGTWGLGGNLGLLFKPTEKLSLGLSYHSPVSFKLKGEYDQKFFFPYNESKLNYFPVDDQALDGFRFIFSGQGEQILLGPDAARATLDLPQDLGAGLAFRPNERWTVAADFAWYNWKVMDSLAITFEDTALTAQLKHPTFQFGWKNTVRFSTGAMYRYQDRWVFRMGYFFDQSPIPDSTFNPLFLDVGNKHAFNFGVSWLLGDWELNYNFGFLTAQKREFSGVNGLFVNLPGTYKDSRFLSAASVTYRFDIKSASE